MIPASENYRLNKFNYDGYSLETCRTTTPRMYFVQLITFDCWFLPVSKQTQPHHLPQASSSTATVSFDIMASLTPSTTLVVFNAVSAKTAVRNKASSFDLDSFDFSKAMEQLAFKNTNASMPSNPADRFSRLPKDILKKVLGLLLTSTKPLVLGVDEDTPVSNGLELAILQSSHYVSMIGAEILYGCNDFTTSSPATSFDFDKDLLQLPGKNLQLIRHIQLEIDWADKLWAKFPLIASVVGSIRGLKSLKITMVPKTRNHVIEEVVSG